MKNITAFLVYNQSLLSPHYQRQLELYQQGALENQISLQLISNHSLRPAVINGAFSLGIDLKPFDFCLFLDKDVSLATQIQSMGVPVFNKPQAIALCDNKINMTQALAEKNIPLCDSFFSTTQFFPIDEGYFMADVAEKLQFPLIIKEAYGSFGEQVYLVHTMEEMITIRNKIDKKPYLYQRYLPSSHGKDLRIYVCGGKVIASLKRQHPDDFRANITIGGEVSAYSPTESEKNLAIRASEALGTLFSGVDILWDEKGNPVLCEVNASAHIKGHFDFCQENLAIPIFAEIKSRLV